jgi:hypothetical protein
MRKLYFLCVLTLGAVILGFVFLHSGPVYAQQSGIRIQRINVGTQAETVNPVSGRVVGFSCTGEGLTTFCFVATSPN